MMSKHFSLNVVVSISGSVVSVVAMGHHSNSSSTSGSSRSSTTTTTSTGSLPARVYPSAPPQPPPAPAVCTPNNAPLPARIYEWRDWQYIWREVQEWEFVGCTSWQFVVTKWWPEFECDCPECTRRSIR